VCISLSLSLSFSLSLSLYLYICTYICILFVDVFCVFSHSPSLFLSLSLSTYIYIYIYMHLYRFPDVYTSLIESGMLFVLTLRYRTTIESLNDDNHISRNRVHAFLLVYISVRQNIRTVHAIMHVSASSLQVLEHPTQHIYLSSPHFHVYRSWQAYTKRFRYLLRYLGY
jgi:hypothetical protein